MNYSSGTNAVNGVSLCGTENLEVKLERCDEKTQLTLASLR